MTEPTAPAPEGNTPDAAPASTPDATPETPANVDETTGLNGDAEPAQGDLFDSPKEEQKPEEKEEPAKEEKQEDTDEPTEEDGDKESPTAEELGYENVREDQRLIVEMAVEHGISQEKLIKAVVNGELDVSQLGDIPARDAAVLKSTVEAAYIKMRGERGALRSELHKHAGGEDNFKAMVDWANKLIKSDPAFKAEVSDMLTMMKQGGTQAKLAVNELFGKFKADPKTTLPTTEGENSDMRGTDTNDMTKREKLDKGWDTFAQKYNMKK